MTNLQLAHSSYSGLISRTGSFILALFFSTTTIAQTDFVTGTKGHWDGYMIRNGNSVQHFEVDFEPSGDSIVSTFTIPEWVYYAPVISKVTTEANIISFNSHFGKMTLQQDSAYAEMIGECGFANVHMKKGLRPPRQQIIQEEITFDLGDIKTSGYVFHPKGEGPFPAVIIVQGRGCGEALGWDRKPEALVQYGLAVVVYDKRGSGPSGFPCKEITLDLLTDDMVAMTQAVDALDVTGPVGYLGYSAGGWLAPKAAAQSPVDIAFIATVVGPSTSVKQQQLDCGRYYCAEALNLGPEQIEEVLAYTELEFSDASPKKVYKELMKLLENGKKSGWIDVMEEDDIPKSAAQLDELWVRRNRYDPGEDLKNYKGPFLSVLGGDDWVVPWKENAERFHTLFKEAGKSNYKVAVVPSASHGMEHGNELRDLGYNRSIDRWNTYFKYDRVAPGAMDEFIAFLREYNFIP